MSTHVLYHAHCTDGFAAAFTAWLAFGDKATYTAVNYREPLPEIPAGADVYILDFSYPRAVLLELSARVNTLIVLDHHETAEQDLAGLDLTPIGRVQFDMTKCGCVLTWEHFFPGTPVPDLLRYVQDRDLWQWLLPQSKEVSAALTLYPRDFLVWQALLGDSETLPTLMREGHVCLRMERSLVQRLARRAEWIDLAGHHVPAVETSLYQSEVGNELLEQHPEAPFALCYFQKGPRRIWSLRSGPNFNVADLCRQFGGGGHPQAAGFETTTEALPSIKLIAAERAHQIRDHHHTAAVDSGYAPGRLAEAALCYADTAAAQLISGHYELPANHQHTNWPWEPAMWRPSRDPARNLTKAAALLAAEIDRLKAQQPASIESIPSSRSTEEHP